MSGVSFTALQDSENRLTRWTRTNGEAQSWALSLVGDWNSTAGQKLQGGTVYPFDELRATTTQSTNFKASPVAGTVKPVTHDAKGNITQDEQGNTYTYDFDNQLVEAKAPNGTVLGTSPMPSRNTSDGKIADRFAAIILFLGRRTTKTADNQATNVSTTTAYVCLTDASGMGQIISEYETGGLVRHTTYGSYVDEPLALRVKAECRRREHVLVPRRPSIQRDWFNQRLGQVVERYAVHRLRRPPFSRPERHHRAQLLRARQRAQASRVVA